MLSCALVRDVAKAKPCIFLISTMLGETILNAFNTLRPRQHGSHFPDDIFKWIFLNENVWILIKISLKFVPRGPISNIPALVQIMAWRRPGDTPLSEPMAVSLLMHIYVTRPQWVTQEPELYLWTMEAQITWLPFRGKMFWLFHSWNILLWME